jgi:hypothetical protein
VLLLASPPTAFNYPLLKNVLFTKLLAGTPTKAGDIKEIKNELEKSR